MGERGGCRGEMAQGTGRWRQANVKGDRENPTGRASNVGESWHAVRPGLGKGERAGKRAGKRVGKAKATARLHLGEVLMAKADQQAGKIVASIANGNEEMLKKGSADCAMRVCCVSLEEKVNADGSTSTSVKHDEDFSAFTTSARNSPFCNEDGGLCTVAECRKLFEVHAPCQGPRVGDVEMTGELMHHHAHVAHGVEQNPLERMHTNSRFEKPDPGVDNGNFHANTNASINLLTRNSQEPWRQLRCAARQSAQTAHVLSLQQGHDCENDEQPREDKNTWRDASKEKKNACSQGKFQLLHPAAPCCPFPRGNFHARGNAWSFAVHGVLLLADMNAATTLGSWVALRFLQKESAAAEGSAHQSGACRA